MGSVLEELTAIKTVAEMTEALRDEAWCRRLVEAMVWPNGRLCPACGSRRSITLAVPPGTLSVLQSGLPLPVHRDDANPVAWNEAAVADLAHGAVVHPAIGQGHLVHPSG